MEATFRHPEKSVALRASPVSYSGIHSTSIPTGATERLRCSLPSFERTR
jgi:hypothetical protein